MAVLLSLTSISRVKNSNGTRYVFHSKYDSHSITLFEDGTFTQHGHSCTYVFNCKGTWKQTSDTITLIQTKFKKCRGGFNQYAERSNELIILSDSSANYAWYINNGFGTDFVMRRLNDPISH